MQLYDIILRNEKGEAQEIRNELLKKYSRKHNDVEKITEMSYKNHIATAVLLLNAAYRHPDSELTDRDLDYLISEIREIQQFCFRGVIDPPQMVLIRKRWIKAVFNYYQQLFKQDGKATSFEQLVQQQFRDESSYRNALQPIEDVNEMIYCVVSTIAPQLTKTLQDTVEVEKTVKERRIKALFP